MNIKKIDFKIDELKYMKKTPKEIFYIGNTELLKRRKISIVGTRKPSQYTKLLTHEISSKLSISGITIVSGAAMGVDAVAHNAAGEENTIAIAGTGLDIRYPAVNKKLIERIEKSGLMLSLFKADTPSQRYNFPIRNELVVALGEILIVTQADENSGTIRSVEYALGMGKKIYVLPHRLNESKGTLKLLEKGLAQPIYDMDKFVDDYGGKTKEKGDDEFLLFCESFPTYDEAMKIDPQKLFEYELSGKIKVENGIVIREL